MQNLSEKPNKKNQVKKTQQREEGVIYEELNEYISTSMVAHCSHKKITWNITKHQEILADFNSNPEKIKQNKIKMENY